jgi:hypothetical protein
MATQSPDFHCRQTDWRTLKSGRAVFTERGL